MKPKFFIVTPCFNSEKYLEETILSVINQSAIINDQADLEYWIVDGNSKDKTLDIIKKYESYDFIKYLSEADQGMYHALTKGFRQLQGGAICGYINAGDLLSPKCFEIATEVFSKFHDVKWITGINTFYNEKSQIVNMNTPFKYRSKMLQQGFYGSILPCIQQESTFWLSSLMADLNYDQLKLFKLAGDSYIWNHFSKKTDLHVVQAYLSGFKVHAGQLSEEKNLYKRELQSYSEPKALLHYAKAFFDILLWHAPNKIKKMFNKKMIVFNYSKNSWEN